MMMMMISNQRTSLRILIIEDCPDDAMLLRLELEHTGLPHEVEVVGERAAIEAALNDNPQYDVILCDHQLPGLTSREVLAMVQTLQLDIPVILVSSRVGEDEAVRAMHHGATDYLLKDRLARLGPAIERAVERRKQQEVSRQRDRLKKESRRMHATIRAHKQVITVIGHELRTPLASMRATSEMVLDQPGKHKAEELERIVGTIHDQIVRIADVLNDLLDVTRLNEGAIAWQWDEFHVEEPCRDALASIAPLVDTHRVQLLSSVDPSDLRMRGDSTAIRRLLVNLLSNACRHTTDGSVSVDIQQAGPERVRIRVIDTGTGIDPQIHESLGLPFALGSGLTDTKHTGGSGLGLAICKGIAAAHGGTINIHSTPGQGTTVNVLLAAWLDAPSTTDALPRSQSDTTTMA